MYIEIWKNIQEAIINTYLRNCISVKHSHLFYYFIQITLFVLNNELI